MMTRIFIIIIDVEKTMKPLWKVKGFFNRTSWKVSDVQIVCYICDLSLSLSHCVSVCCVLCVVVVVVVVVVVEEGGERGEGE